MCHNDHDMFHFPHSWIITGFVTSVTRGVLLVPTLPEHMSSPPIVGGIRVAWSFVFCVVYLCVLSLLTIVLSVLFKLRIVITPFLIVCVLCIFPCLLCVPYVPTVPGSSILDCPLGFVWRLFPVSIACKCYMLFWFIYA